MAESVLLHVCCAHCAAYTAEHWRRQGYRVTGLWYNPNIYPFIEHRRRLAAVRRLFSMSGLRLLEVPGYDPAAYLKHVGDSHPGRCQRCFELRLERTAAEAKANGFDAFSTSLLISPHQEHETLVRAADGVSLSSGVTFAYADLRKRYSDSRHITKPMKLYRQCYCGCFFSQYERHQGEVKTEVE